MIRKLWPVIAALVLVGCASKPKVAPLEEAQTLKLWTGQAPAQQGETDADIPVVQVFLPQPGKATGASFVICPGGGYGGLARHEREVVGQWMASNGITGFVLRYRLAPKYHHPTMLTDVQRAIQFVRANAKYWDLDPERIGVMGFSAGGHLASSAATHFAQPNRKSPDPVERVSSRPNLQVLIYPVITMRNYTHQGSKRNLLGDNPPQDLVDLMSSELQVTRQTPPAFLVHSTTDTVVPVENSDMYADALRRNGIPYEYVRGDMGQHGFGLTPRWTAQCIAWLQRSGFAAR